MIGFDLLHYFICLFGWLVGCLDSWGAQMCACTHAWVCGCVSEYVHAKPRTKSAMGPRNKLGSSGLSAKCRYPHSYPTCSPEQRGYPLFWIRTKLGALCVKRERRVITQRAPAKAMPCLSLPEDQWTCRCARAQVTVIIQKA